MAKRYIDADMLYGDMLYAMVMTGYQSKALSVIEEQPTADVQEVRHCTNENKDYHEVDQFVCSGGGIELQGWHKVERDEDNGDTTDYEYAFKYCPNCGAKIDEEKNI